MKSTPTVSVAMATFNGAEYLPEQLESIASQSFPPTELVVSDDGSDDATVDILRAFARAAPFEVRVLCNQPRVGFARNFERALRGCKGDLVFFSDQDDVWFESKIERVVETMRTRPRVQLVIHDTVVTDSSLKPTFESTLAERQARRMPIGEYVAGSATAVRQPLVELALPFPDVGPTGHDGWMHMLARSLGSEYVLDEALMWYRRHGDNTSRSVIEPGRRTYVVPSFLSSMARRVRLVLSDNSRSRRLMQYQAMQAELASRLRTPEAEAIDADAREAAVEAERRATAFGLRVEAHRANWYRRIRFLERARRSGAYSSGVRGLAAYGLDLVTPRWRR